MAEEVFTGLTVTLLDTQWQLIASHGAWTVQVDAVVATVVLSILLIY